MPAAPRFHLAKASSSSGIFCFAQADAFSVGDDRIWTADQSQLAVASLAKQFSPLPSGAGDEFVPERHYHLAMIKYGQDSCCRRQKADQEH